MKWIANIYEKLSNAWYRMRLKNDNFTIITNTCIAGVMYHKLGKQFLSPTINLWMYDVEFYRFVHNMDYYFAQPLKFVNVGETYPTAYCGDVLIYFNHYHSEEEADAKWKERIKRINKDNLFIICADRPLEDIDITHEDILSLKDIPCRGKVVFSTKKYDDVDYIVPYRRDVKGDYVAVYMNDRTKYTRRWLWESAFDWVHWLNTGEVKVMS